jgi:23S rRNA pseudouridine1911/1915/1917 synthase
METDGSPPLEFTVTPEEEDTRLEQFVRRRISGVSRRSVQRLLERHLVLVDGKSQPKGWRLRAGQQVVVAVAARLDRPMPQLELDLPLLAVRPDLVAINKPAGRACHPLVPGETDTVANALVARFPECALASPTPREGGLVHRLDWSTSGVLLAARSPEAYGRIRGLFSSGQVEKRYLALVVGPVLAAGRVRFALRTVPGDSSRMEVALSGRETLRGQDAETEYRPLENKGQYGLVECLARTGRRHQIRVHMAHAGHVLVGDELYGGPPLPEGEGEGAFLHASFLQLLPGGEVFSAPLPEDRARVLESLGFSWSEAGGG